MAIQISGNTVINNSRRFFGGADNNIFIGGGSDSVTGDCNIVIGNASGTSLNDCIYCTPGIPGSSPLPAKDNILIGYCTGTNVKANGNIIIGSYAGLNLGYQEVDFGGGMVFHCYSTDNTVIGCCAGTCLSNDSKRNVVIGNLAETFCLTDYCDVVSIGYCAGGLQCSTSVGALSGCYGQSGAFFGNRAGYRQCSAATLNSLFGRFSGCWLTTGNKNVLIGSSSGYQMSSGSCNVAVGYLSGSSLSPDHITTQCNRIVIGHNTSSSARIKISWTTTSDIRTKCVWGSVPHGRDFLRNVTPIKYTYKDYYTEELVDNKKRFGFSAQEVSALEGDEKVITFTDNPDELGMTYEYFIPVLVNAIKELDEENQLILSRLNALENLV